MSYLMEGTVAKLVLHVDPDPVGEQELDHVDLTKVGRHVERRVPAPITVQYCRALTNHS